uniref:ADP-ribosylation factor-like protein 13B n=1 Tax=Phallusia mammillata TaxID=59560 RepID=A0A6F9D666_9ASCI|nr:ADP-ribosylation factor-like protein 13B [Phallusia mammillata]
MVEIMGNCLPWLNSKNKRRKVSFLMVGLDNAGKTTAVKGVQGQPVADVAPTVGFSSVDIRNGIYDVTMIDLGGGSRIRDIWKNYLAEIHAVVFVVDSTDVERMTECKETLQKLLENPLIQRKPVLLLANKQDKDSALEEYEICESLNVEEIVNANQCLCKVVLCAALTSKPGKKGMDPALKGGFAWLLHVVGEQYETLNERIVADVKKREILREEEIKISKERVRLIREERARLEEEAQANGDVPQDSPSKLSSTTNNANTSLDVEGLLPGSVADETGKASALSVRSGLGDQLLDDEEELPGSVKQTGAEDSCTESQQRSNSRMSNIVRDVATPSTPSTDRLQTVPTPETDLSSEILPSDIKKKKRRKRKNNQVIPLSSDQLPLSSVVLPPIETKGRLSSIENSLGQMPLPPVKPNIDSEDDILT